MGTKTTWRRWRLVALAAVALTVPGTAAFGQGDTCNGSLVISLSMVPMVNTIGVTDPLELRFGAGPIEGGNTITYPSVVYDLDCVEGTAPNIAGCMDDGQRMRYLGDATLSTNCGLCSGGDRAGLSCNTANGNLDCTMGGTCNAISVPS